MNIPCASTAIVLMLCLTAGVSCCALEGVFRMSGFKFTIERDGSVSESGMIAPEESSEKINRCVLPVVCSWRFFPPSDGNPVRVRYPINVDPPE